METKQKGCRLDRIIMAFETVKALKHPITAEELAFRLKRSKQTAYRYIDAASIVFPVIESEDFPHKFSILE